jgi:hypothetical protein
MFEEVNPRLFTQVCEWATTKYERIKQNTKELKVWIETFDFNKPSITPVIIMIAAVGLKALFTLFDYITYLEHKYLPEVSYETYHKMLNVYCVLNLILCCFIGRALWLYDENDEIINIEYEVIEEEPSIVVPSVVPSNEAPSVVPLNEVPSVVPSNEVPSVVPSNEVPSVVPSNEVPSVVPSNEVPSVVPSNEEPSVVPSKFTEEEYDEICEFAKNKNIDVEEATVYMTSCHYCGCKNIPVNQTYCKSRCENYIEDFTYACYRHREGVYCAICVK